MNTFARLLSHYHEAFKRSIPLTNPKIPKVYEEKLPYTTQACTLISSGINKIKKRVSNVK